MGPGWEAWPPALRVYKGPQGRHVAADFGAINRGFHLAARRARLIPRATLAACSSGRRPDASRLSLPLPKGRSLQRRIHPWLQPVYMAIAAILLGFGFLVSEGFGATPVTVSMGSINGVTSISENALNVAPFAQVACSAATTQPLTVYLVNSTSAAVLGKDYNCSALTPVSGLIGVYSVTIPTGQTTVPLTAVPVADWIPEGNRAFGYTLLTQSSAAWQSLSPQPAYTSPTNPTEVQVNVIDVNINASVTLTNPTTTQGQTTNLPTLTFTRDITPIASTIYFSLTSSNTSTALSTQIQVTGATLLSGSTYSVQLGGTATSGAVQITPKSGSGVGFTTTITAQILGFTDAGVGSLVRYAVASPSSQSISILNTYPTVSLQVLQPTVAQNGQTQNVIAVNRTSQGLASPLTINLTQTASQARIVYDYYLFDNNGTNISNPASFPLTFPAGVAQIFIGMQGVANGLIEPNQLVGWQLTSSSSYAASTAQANIILISTTVQIQNPGVNAVFTLDFEHGMLASTGQTATSQYGLTTTIGQGALYPEGLYAIGANPNYYHNGFSSYFDHTLGTASGHMMIINGAVQTNVSVLAFTVAHLTPGQPYYVNYYGSSCDTAAPALMDMIVNGTKVGQAHFNAGTAWVAYAYVFYPDANGNAVISFLNENTVASGNDFALDDVTVGLNTSPTNLVDLDNSQTPASILEYTAPSGTGLVKAFTVRRDRDSTPNAPERIYLTQTAQSLVQAVYGTDYTSTQLLFDSVHSVYYVDLPVGQLAVDVYVTPVDNWIPGANKAFGYRLLTFSDSAWTALAPVYYPNDSVQAQVTIQNVSINATVAAVNQNLFENQPSPTQVFAINRDQGGLVAGKVYFTLTSASTAKLGTNFTWTGATLDSVTGLYYVLFTAGQTQAMISVQPLATGVIGPDLTITPQIIDATDSRLTGNQTVLYRAGSPATATAYLHQTSTVVNLSVTTPTVTQGQASTAVLQIQGPTSATSSIRVYLALNPTGTTAVYPGAFTTTDLTYDPTSGYFYADITFSVTPTKTISIKPDDFVNLPSRTLAWTLVGPAAVQAQGFIPAYQLGANTGGTVTILPNTVVATLALTTPLQQSPTLAKTVGATPVAVVTRSRSGQAQTVTLTPSGTGVLGADYTVGTPASAVGGSIQVAFAAGDLTETVPLTPIDDHLVNTDKAVTWTVAAGITYAVGSPNVVSFSLTDPQPNVSLALGTGGASMSINEFDPATLVFKVTRDRTGVSQVVYLKLIGTPTIQPGDYTAPLLVLFSYNLLTVTFPASANEVDVLVDPIDNDWATPPRQKQAIVQLAIAADVGASLGYNPVSPTPLTFNILDSSPTVTLALTPALQTSPTLLKTVGATPVAVVTRSRSGQAQTVTLTVSGTGVLGIDYTVGAPASAAGGSIQVAFASGDLTETVPLTPIDDHLINTNKTVTWTVAAGATYTIGSPSVVTFTLTDPPANLSLALAAGGSAMSINETDPATLVLKVTRDRTGAAVTVYVKTVGTPTALAADYIAPLLQSVSSSMLTVAFSATATEVDVLVTPVDNDWATPPRQKQVVWQLATAAEAGQILTYTPVSPTPLTLNIVDTPPTVTLSLQGPGSIPRGVPGGNPAISTATFTVNRTRSGQAQTVYVQATGAAVMGTDYTVAGTSASPISVPFSSTALSQTFTVTTVDNALIEGSPVLKLQVVPDGPFTGTLTTYLVGSPGTASLTLADVPDAVSLATSVISPPTPQLRRTDPQTAVFSITRTRSDKAQSVWFTPGSGSNVIVWYPGVTPIAPVTYDLSVTSTGGPVLTDATGNFLVNFPAGSATVTIQATPHLNYTGATTPETYALTLASPAVPAMYTLTSNVTGSVILLGYTPPTIGVSVLYSPATWNGPPGTFIINLSGIAPTASFPLSFTLSGPATSRYFASCNGTGVTAATPSATVYTETGTVQLAPADWSGTGQKVISIASVFTLLPPAILTLTLVPNTYYTFAGQDFTHPLANPPSATVNPPSASITLSSYGVPPAPVAINAALISASSTDPMRILDPGVTTNVTVTGSLVAGGAAGASGTPSLPAPGKVMLKADPNLLDGKVVPPIVPMVMDLRISQMVSSTLTVPTGTGGQQAAATPTPSLAAPKPSPF